LPQIPGIILANSEIPKDRLLGQIRQWAASSPTLSSSGFDLLQIMESTAGRPEPRAICGLLRAQLLLAEGTEPIRAFVTLFYRSRDFLNSEFWEDQVRRLSDIVADEYLAGARGLQLTVHHKVPAWAPGLEIGDHRLLTELQALTVLGRPWRRLQAAPELLQAGADGCVDGGAPGAAFHRLCREGAERGAGDIRGPYVLRGVDGAATCGVEVLGVLPLKLVCAAAWAGEGREADFAALVDGLLRKARRPFCSVLADARDEGWRRLCDSNPGLRRSLGRPGVAVTGVPVGLTGEEQALLARAPFLVPWEFLPFHSGRFVLA